MRACLKLKLCIVSFAVLWSAFWIATPKVEGIEFDLEGIIHGISVNEQLVQDVSATCDIILPDKGGEIFQSYEWGYSRGKEYMRGFINHEGEEPGQIEAFKQHFVFDGEKVYGYAPDTKGGSIGSSTEAFVSFRTPNHFLGYCITPQGRGTLTQWLQRAESKRLAAGLDTVDGHECYVLEANYTDFTFNLKVWIDAGRGFRPLRVEQYSKRSGTLRHMVENIVLREVEKGIWFPVQGDTVGYYIKDEPRPGEYVLGQLGVGRERLVVKTVKVGLLDDSLFKMTYPSGTLIWDGVEGVSYRVP